MSLGSATVPEQGAGAEVLRGERVGQGAAGGGDLAGGDAEGGGQEGGGHRRQRAAVLGGHGGGARGVAGGQLLPGREQAAQIRPCGLGAAGDGLGGQGVEQPAVLAGGGQDVVGEVQDGTQFQGPEDGRWLLRADRDVEVGRYELPPSSWNTETHAEMYVTARNQFGHWYR
ncbi:hypothetical protein [Streptomyces sp. NPDC003996]